MKKRIPAILLTAVLAVPLTACNGDSDDCSTSSAPAAQSLVRPDGKGGGGGSGGGKGGSGSKGGGAKGNKGSGSKPEPKDKKKPAKPVHVDTDDCEDEG